VVGAAVADPVPVRRGVAAQPRAGALLLQLAADARASVRRRRTRARASCALRAVVPRQLPRRRTAPPAAQHRRDCGTDPHSNIHHLIYSLSRNAAAVSSFSFLHSCNQLSLTTLIVVYVFFITSVCLFSFCHAVCLSSLARHFRPVIKSALLRHSSSAAEA
jgi:hypothetical protein